MSDASATYDVDIKLRKVGDGWDDLSAGVGKFTSLLDVAAGKVAALGASAAIGLAVAGVAGLTYGVTKLNAEAEAASISIGTIFSVNGVASSVPQGILMAQDTIAKMRIDAQKLPGEFEDLQKIFMSGAIPLFQAGASVDQARELSANVMAASKVMGLQSDMAAREFGMLLSGRAGAHNVLGTRLGFSGASAQALNKADPAKRLELVSAETKKYSGAIDIFAHSYEGLSSTLVDNVKNFGRLATMPLFETFKEELGEINDWWGSHKNAIDSYAGHLGVKLKEGFQWGIHEIEQWWPLISNFADVAEQRITAVWEDVQPYVSSFASAMREALADPNGTIDKLHDLFLLWAAVQGGSMLLGAGGALGQVAKGLGGGIGWAAGAKTVGVTGVFGGEAAAATGVAGATAGAVGAAALAALAAWGVAAWQAAGLYDELNAQSQANVDAITRARVEEYQRIIKNGEAIGTAFEDVIDRSQTLANTYVIEGDTVKWAMNDVATAAALAAANLNAISGGMTDVDKRGSDRVDDIAGKAASDLMLALRANANGGKGSWDAAAAEAKKPKPSMKGGHGGTSIQKVEIVVTSNQNPSRIALAIHSKLAGLATNRRYSPDVPNFSAPDEGSG